MAGDNMRVDAIGIEQKKLKIEETEKKPNVNPMQQIQLFSTTIGDLLRGVNHANGSDSENGIGIG